MPNPFYIDDILLLFKNNFNHTMGRTSLYYYINKHNFPKPSKWGYPRRWEKAKVLAWFAERKSG